MKKNDEEEVRIGEGGNYKVGNEEDEERERRKRRRKGGRGRGIRKHGKEKQKRGEEKGTE